jgi:hypothetical protein
VTNEELRSEIRELSDNRRQAEQVANEFQKLPESEDRKAERIALANRICGKYAFVPTGSDAFAVNKTEEIALEDRPG